MTKSTFTTWIMTITAFSGLVLAQAPPAGPGRGGPGMNGGTPPDPQQMLQRRVDFLASRLSLTDAQKQQALTIFTAAETAAQPLHTQLRDQHQALADAVKNSAVETQIDALAATVGNLTAQLTAIETKAQAKFYAILTPDQQAKYGAGDGGPGPGPFMGPGMGGFRRGGPRQ